MKLFRRAKLAVFASLVTGFSFVCHDQCVDAQTTTVADSASQARSDAQQDARSEWIQLFNGKDLTGWTPKIRGHELGDNYADTFRVVDGKLVVSYDKYTEADFMSLNPGQSTKPSFDKFGHLFYKDTFSHYVLRVEYRFVGEQVKNGPGWAKRNNGLMLHGQDPATMEINQKFPASIEVQLLGGRGNGRRVPNMNLCTPGTNVVMNGKLFTPHCTQSSSGTYEGERWVTVEAEVRGSDIIRHRVEGETVLEYSQPQYDPNDSQFPMDTLIKDGKLLIEEGTISLQSESAPIEFRKIELRVLGAVPSASD